MRSCCVIFASLSILVALGVGSPAGFSPISGTKRIIGGTDAKEGAAPYIVSLQNYGRHFCGGSIVGDRWILTAAHCVDGKKSNEVMIQAGTNRLDDSRLPYPVDLIVSHNLYNRSLKINDIALIRSSVPLDFSKRIQNIELALDPVPDNATVTLVGWGRTKREGVLAYKLQYIELRYVESKRCQEMLEEPVGVGKLCTFIKKNEGACHGDSGSALTWKGKQIGIASYIHINCAAGFPDVFTRVSYYHEWIRSTMAENDNASDML
uniref:trypsin n=1 Tax=Anopheles dirus TaxID=7168 RepID=A0A1Y9H266_9DIPT